MNTISTTAAEVIALADHDLFKRWDNVEVKTVSNGTSYRATIDDDQNDECTLELFVYNDGRVRFASDAVGDYVVDPQHAISEYEDVVATMIDRIR